eukprot:TRINITY_DN21481_c0_g1_i1.p1 TRINITY_DN21481_c0_g1~~TRINITY_DN21481_c0_g1_i1.p1  ORF type:complete len:210 (-),score=26.43 TRINITY_DN21481_c0_g1_i1:207-836(-)
MAVEARFPVLLGGKPGVVRRCSPGGYGRSTHKGAARLGSPDGHMGCTNRGRPTCSSRLGDPSVKTSPKVKQGSMRRQLADQPAPTSARTTIRREGRQTSAGQAEASGGKQTSGIIRVVGVEKLRRALSMHVEADNGKASSDSRCSADRFKTTANTDLHSEIDSATEFALLVRAQLAKEGQHYVTWVDGERGLVRADSDDWCTSSRFCFS